MKKNLLLAIFLVSIMCLLPMKIKAAENIEIKSIEIASQTKEGMEKSKPSFENLKVNFDLNFEELNDSIKYKLILKNNDDQDYEVQETTTKSEDNYLEYKTSYEGTNNIVKAGEEKIVYITVTYVEEVPVDKFVDGVYNAKNNIKILFSSKEKNPNTLVYGILGIAIPLLVLSIVLIIAGKHKMASLMSFVIGTMLLIPAISIALEKVEIEISSEITINPTEKEFTLKINTECKSDGFVRGTNTKGFVEPDDDEDYKYVSSYMGGMNWQDFFNSDFYDGELEEDAIDVMLNEKFWYVDNQYEVCTSKIKEFEYDEDLSDAENEANWNEYISQWEACEDKYIKEASATDPIQPNTNGIYYSYYYVTCIEE